VACTAAFHHPSPKEAGRSAAVLCQQSALSPRMLILSDCLWWSLGPFWLENSAFPALLSSIGDLPLMALCASPLPFFRIHLACACSVILAGHRLHELSSAVCQRAWAPEEGDHDATTQREACSLLRCHGCHEEGLKRSGKDVAIPTAMDSQSVVHEETSNGQQRQRKQSRPSQRQQPRQAVPAAAGAQAVCQRQESREAVCQRQQSFEAVCERQESPEAVLAAEVIRGRVQAAEVARGHVPAAAAARRRASGSSRPEAMCQRQQSPEAMPAAAVAGGRSSGTVATSSVSSGCFR
jgi:hypothetical protein